MTPIQATIGISGGRIRSVEPLYGGVTIRSEQGEDHYPDAWAMPGFVDSHAHLLGLGMKLTGLSLYTARSAAECVERALNHTRRYGEWLTGMGWNQEQWSSPSLPSAEILDEAFPDTPVYLRRADGHAAWVNAIALERAGITEATPDPDGGVIMRDEDKRPTGILVDNAMDLVGDLIPEAEPDQIREMILIGAQEFIRLGITEIHDMDVAPRLLDIYRDLAESGALPIRIQSFISGQRNEWLKERLLPTSGEFFRLCAVKLFADGALGSRGALLLDPYADAPETRGLQLLTSEEIELKVRSILDYGWNVSIHAIGDAANRNVINVYRKMREQRIADDSALLRIEHAQMVHPDDQSAFGRYNITPAIQPIHCLSDAPMARRRLGDRCSHAYPWRSLRNNGALLSAGSDAPIESADPLIGIDALCRRIPFGEQQPWQPEERITREEALNAYTTWAHEAADVADRRGRLKPKYDADIVILSDNPLQCPEERIISISVLATYTAGNLRYTQNS